MTDTSIPPDADDGKTEQTREIERVLEAAAARPEPTAGKSEWDAWEDSIQQSVDKLLSDSRTFKLGLLAVGGLAGLALGVAGMSMKAIQSLAEGLNQVGANQHHMAQQLGMVPTPQPSSSSDMVMEAVKLADPVADTTVLDAKSFDVPTDAVVAPPVSGPASEASADAVAQMQADKAAGIIDHAKDHNEPL